MLQTWAEISLLFFVILFSLIAVGALVVLAFAVKKLEGLLEKVVAKIDPVIVKTSATLDSVQRVTANVGEKADQILTRGEALTEDLSRKVESTATVVEETVTTPLINLSSLIAGVTKGVSVWGKSVSPKTNGKNGSGASGVR